MASHSRRCNRYVKHRSSIIDLQRKIVTISTKQFEVFLAVIECGTVTRAAERLYLSQPAVSRTLESSGILNLAI
ncbi:MAG: hypothetical protein COC19_02620 [SAR86 cluster bacterium]|uniref:HTH lysR-type domain-containing protein n=1 Tax=SAR86 cluster bacterium TaxID=2030880 RepID=A0A2A4MRX5_9GAMM|nr:MAG: hypothetical protein COC19_02620 [SAR86 cluster bacterium]